MNKKRSEIWKQIHSKLTSTLGMTMAELMLVLGIIAALAAVAFLGVQRYQLSLNHMERDGIAKEIFITAQNHLTTARGEGYLSTDPAKFGTKGTAAGDVDADGNSLGVYYFVVKNGDAFADKDSLLQQMLPFGSVDETIRLGSWYVIRYQPETAKVLDVFYCSTHGTPARYNRNGSDSPDTYTELMGLTGADKKAARRSWSGGLLGWYGGTEAEKLEELELAAPELELHNEEQLYVVVRDTNQKNLPATCTPNDALLQLVIEGMTSGAQRAITLDSSASGRVSYQGGTTEDVYTIVLDDITESGMGFSAINTDYSGTGTFLPGENIRVRAVAYSKTKLARVMYSSAPVTNSLFAGLEKSGLDTSNPDVQDTALVSNIRHLENLNDTLSGMVTTSQAANAGTGESALLLSRARQTTNLSWPDFQTKIAALKGITGQTNIDAIHVVGAAQFLPVAAGYQLEYDGQRHSISDVIVRETEQAGLFALPTSGNSVKTIQDLELIDFNITGTGTAGALAGSLGATTVTNVLARTSDATAYGTAKITGATAGGLVGAVSGSTTIEYSAAAVAVNGSNIAGGLVGSMSAGTITGSYSGGHTVNGVYETTAGKFNVTGATAGGLVGSMSGGSVTGCYSTCSVSGSTKAGGFAGNAAGGSISNNYCTGRVQGGNAFVGAEGATIGTNWYYEIVNDYIDTNDHDKVKYLGSGTTSTNVVPFDSMAAYTSFVGNPSSDWEDAMPYDSALRAYFGGLYSLRSMERLLGATKPADYFVITHYGDWPSAETFVINQ